jgi:hypothetical protein
MIYYKIVGMGTWLAGGRRVVAPGGLHLPDSVAAVFGLHLLHLQHTWLIELVFVAVILLFDLLLSHLPLFMGSEQSRIFQQLQHSTCRDIVV